MKREDDTESIIGFHVTQDPVSGEQSPCLSNGNQDGCCTAGVLGYSLTNPGLTTPTAIRRLTPTECLRLQGLPDSWLDVELPLSDSAKYRMIGNGGAVTVVEWIGNRIKAKHREVFDDRQEAGLRDGKDVP